MFEEKYYNFSSEVIIFTAVKNCCILHMCVFVMCSLASLREEKMEREKQGKFLSTC